MTTPILAQDPSSTGWEQTIYAFLAEKERRSGSRRTVESYSRMLYQFFGSLGKPPGQITFLGHHRSPDCLPQFLLSVPHSHGPGQRTIIGRVAISVRPV